MNIRAAKIANETIQYKVEEPMNQLTRAITPAPMIRPKPIIPSGAKLPLVKVAMSPMRRNTPAVIPKAIPIICQSMKIVKQENKKPTMIE